MPSRWWKARRLRLLDLVHATAARLKVAIAVAIAIANTKLTNAGSVTQFRSTKPLFLGWVLPAHFSGQLLRARRVLLRR